ncbi:MAG: histidine phosphatase family protein [Ruminococcaceae bacterium]|nr:histidine phosphatase family protein [Oscillospiraceae bacterium]
MKLYLIRHGESVNNLEMRHSGHSLTPLTEKGITDAKKAGKLLNGINFDKVFSSDLPRASATCEYALPGAEYEKLKLIREVNVGTLSDRLVSECTEQYGEEYKKLRATCDFTRWNGENFEMTCARAKKFLTMLEGCDYENVAAFSHGTFIEYILCTVLGYDAARNAILYNGGICVFEYKDAKWSLIRWNYTGEI